MSHSSFAKGRVLAKLIVVGDVAAGKTCFLRRYVDNVFTDGYQSTIGVDFFLETETVNGVSVNVQLWDTAGQERFKGLAKLYYQDSCGALIMFDVTDRKSFKSSAWWKRDIDDKVRLKNGEQIPVVLLATKCDLVDRQSATERAISDQEIAEFAAIHNFAAWYRTSAKHSVNIQAPVRFLVTKVLENRAALSKQGLGELDPLSVVVPQEPAPKRRGCC